MPHVTPLTDIQRRHGATFTTLAGYEVPRHFGHPEHEYQQALSGSVMFDRSPAGKIDVSGADAASFLHNLCTNDIIGLPIGAGCEAYFCDRRAKTLAQALIYNRSTPERQRYWLDVALGFGAKLLQHLDRHLISEAVEFTDATNLYAQMHLAGPQAMKVLSAVFLAACPKLAEFEHVERRIGPVTCQIRRHDPLGVPGYDVICSNEMAAPVWEALRLVEVVPAGLDTYEVLRVEAGTPEYGIDIDDDRFVMEVARAQRAVSFSKGCYIGQEPIVMARDRAGFVNRTFLGMKVIAGGPLVAGTKLLHEGAEVGRVTSSLHSPRLKTAIALGYIRRGHQEPGTRLEADTTDGRRTVEVLPFPPVS